jgi:hypothetical protein
LLFAAGGVALWPLLYQVLVALALASSSWRIREKLEISRSQFAMAPEMGVLAATVLGMDGRFFSTSLEQP